MTAPSIHVRRLLLVALAVVVVDLTTKAVAIATLAEREIALGGPFFLGLLFNDAILAGLSTLNGWALPVSALASVLLVVLALPVCAPLAEHDAAAPVALGLMVGAAVANPASLMLQSSGVTDFLGVAFGSDIAVLFNLADVAAYVGLAISGRTLMRVLAAYRIERGVRHTRVLRRRPLEREVPLAVWQDARREAPAPLPVPATLIPFMAGSNELRMNSESQGVAGSAIRQSQPRVPLADTARTRITAPDDKS